MAIMMDHANRMFEWGGGEHGGWIYGRCDGKWFHWSEGNLSVIWLLGGISHREILHSTMDDLPSSVICSPCAKNACHPPKFDIFNMEREKWWFGWMFLSSFLFWWGQMVNLSGSNRPIVKVPLEDHHEVMLSARLDPRKAPKSVAKNMVLGGTVARLCLTNNKTWHLDMMYKTGCASESKSYLLGRCVFVMFGCCLGLVGNTMP